MKTRFAIGISTIVAAAIAVALSLPNGSSAPDHPRDHGALATQLLEQQTSSHNEAAEPRVEVDSADLGPNELSSRAALMHRIDACFAQARDPLSCLEQIPELTYDAKLYAELIAALAVNSRDQAAVLAASFLSRSDPIDALEQFLLLDRLARAASPRIDSMLLERGITIALSTLRVDWHELIASALPAELVFDPQESESGVILARHLGSNGSGRALECLRTGLASGLGNEMQQARAVAALAVTASNDIAAHIELASVVNNTVPGQPSEAAAMAGILALRPRYWPDGDPTPAIQLVDRILADPAWGAPLAAQIRADYPKGPPKGITASEWRTIELALEYWD